MEIQLNSSFDLAGQLDRAVVQGLGTPVLYKVHPGDRVSRILHNYYDAPPGSARYREAELTFRYFNPAVTDPNHIVIGQILKLMPLPQGGGTCPIPDDFDAAQLNAFRPTRLPRHRLEPASSNYVERIGQHIPSDPAERDAFFALAWLEENYNWFAQPAGAGMTTFGLLTGHGNAALLQDVGSAYEQYRRGVITKGQYDYRRRKALQTFSKKVGPAEKILLRGQRANEAIRISRVKAVPATHRIDTTAARLGQMSRYAARGGVLLAGANLYMGCKEIGATSNTQKKNEILVETVTGTGFGLVAGFVLAAVLVSNPVGWGVALVLAAGSAAASTGMGIGARHVYNRWGNGIDLATEMGVTEICR